MRVGIEIRLENGVIKISANGKSEEYRGHFEDLPLREISQKLGVETNKLLYAWAPYYNQLKELESEKEKTVYEKYFDIPENGKGKPRFISKKLGDELLINHTFLTMWDNGEIYYYDKGIYLPNGESLIQTYCTAVLEKEFSAHRVSEVTAYIQGKTRKFFIHRSDLDSDPTLLPLQNGVLNIETMQLNKYDFNHIFFAKLPVAYDPQAKCKNFLEFLNQITDPHGIDQIQEFLGYCLYRRYTVEKILLLIGKGQNGKSTLINIIITFLGKNNVSNQSLQNLLYQPFARARLFGKLLNAFADLSDAALKSTGTGEFKALTGNDYLEARHLFHNFFQFKNTAKFIFSANKVPETEDQTDAFFTRFIIINFPNQFLGEAADRQLAEKLTTPEEMSGILNWALEGLKRLLKNGVFSHEQSIDEIREIYIKLSNTIQAFAFECLEYDPQGEEPKDEIYNYYVSYCYDLDRIPTDKTVFAKKLPSYFKNPVKVSYPRIGKKRVHCWKGIKIKENLTGSTGSSGSTIRPIKGEFNSEKTLDTLIGQDPAPLEPPAPNTPITIPELPKGLRKLLIFIQKYQPTLGDIKNSFKTWTEEEVSRNLSLLLEKDLVESFEQDRVLHYRTKEGVR